MTDSLLTARDVAEMLGMSPRWVLNEFYRARIPGFKLADGRGPVRFRQSEVERWLETRHRGPEVAA